MLDKKECQKFITKLIKLVKDKKLAKAYDKKAFNENFETFDAHREHVEAALDNQRQYEAGSRLYEQTAEKLALQRSLGTAHAEMLPNQHGDIAARYNKLRVLIQQNVGTGQQAQARTLQRRNQAQRPKGNARLAFSSGYQYQR